MAITFDELGERLEGIDQLELDGLHITRVTDEAAGCMLFMQTEEYVNPVGDPGLLLVCHLDRQGTYLVVAAPEAYSTEDAAHPGARFEALLRACHEVRHVRAELDASAGTVRLAIDIPVGDGTLTSQQLHTMVGVLVKVVDEFHAVLEHAMDTGEIDMGRRLSCRRASGGDEPGDGKPGGGDRGADGHGTGGNAGGPRRQG
ncbi:MAG: hypothetical protein ACKOSS_06490 [Planctomycetia bacterium]